MGVVGVTQAAAGFQWQDRAGWRPITRAHLQTPSCSAVDDWAPAGARVTKHTMPTRGTGSGIGARLPRRRCGMTFSSCRSKVHRSPEISMLARAGMAWECGSRACAGMGPRPWIAVGLQRGLERLSAASPADSCLANPSEIQKENTPGKTQGWRRCRGRGRRREDGSALKPERPFKNTVASV